MSKILKCGFCNSYSVELSEPFGAFQGFEFSCRTFGCCVQTPRMPSAEAAEKAWELINSTSSQVRALK